MQCLTHEIHFWIGSGSSHDKKGTAAYRTVDLYRHVSPYHTQILVIVTLIVPLTCITLMDF